MCWNHRQECKHKTSSWQGCCTASHQTVENRCFLKPKLYTLLYLGLLTNKTCLRVSNPYSTNKKCIWKCCLLKLCAAKNCLTNLTFRCKQFGPRSDSSSDLGPHCQRGFWNISADDKIKRLVVMSILRGNIPDFLHLHPHPSHSQ